MNINGKTIIRFKVVEKGGEKKILWNASLSKKDVNGKTIWYSVPTYFVGDSVEEIKNVFKTTKFNTDDKRVTIDITEGFISGYLDKDKKTVITFVINKFKKVELKEKKNEDIDL